MEPLKKLGANNPLEVKVPADYQKIIQLRRTSSVGNFVIIDGPA